jgi:AhpD family alkylhydroperoxidase
MESRMANPAVMIPGAMEALQALHAAVESCGVPERTLELMNIRASQINGCAVCLDMHPKLAKKAGASDSQINGVAAWREMPYFDDAEQAALGLVEAATRLADRPDAVSDEIWDEAARHYDEKQLAGLTLSIAGINVWNRLNATTRQIAGITW